MKKAFLLLFYFFITSQLAHASLKTVIWDMDITAGYKRDFISFNSDSEKSPFMASALQAKNLHAFETGTSVQAHYKKNYIKGAFNFGKIVSGSFNEYDYWNTGRIELLRSTSKFQRGNIYDLSFTYGYKLDFFEQSLNFIPLIGYSINNIQLKLKRSFYMLDLIKFEPHLINSNNTYCAHFQGPFIGSALTYKVTSKISIHALFEYHFANYSAIGKWNEKTSLLKKFRQTATGFGTVSSAETSYQINDKFSLGLNITYKKFEAKKGSSKTALLKENETNTFPSKFKQPFNKVNWKSLYVSLTTKYQF